MGNLPHVLKLGVIYQGPDYAGCINTGFAPALLKSRLLHDWPGLSRGFRFVVGPRSLIEAAPKALNFDQIRKGQAYYQPNTPGLNDPAQHRVRFFKTAASAKQHFLALVAAAEAQNNKIRDRQNQLRKRARAGESDAAVALIDF